MELKPCIVYTIFNAMFAYFYVIALMSDKHKLKHKKILLFWFNMKIKA